MEIIVPAKVRCLVPITPAIISPVMVTQGITILEIKSLIRILTSPDIISPDIISPDIISPVMAGPLDIPVTNPAKAPDL